MSVVAFVGESSDAQAVVTWAGRFAAALHAELIVFYRSASANVAEVATELMSDDQYSDENHQAVATAIEGVVRTKRARKGRLARHAVSVRRVSPVDPVADTIDRMRVESPQLFVGSATDDALSNGKPISQQIAAKLSCDVMMLHQKGRFPSKLSRAVVVTSEGNHDNSAVELAAQAAATLTDGVTVLGIEASVGQGAIEVQERQLRSLLRDLELEENAHLQVKAVQTDEWVEAIATEADACDLLLVGADLEKKVPSLVDETSHATVGVIRRAPRLAFGRQRKHAAFLLPQINPTDYADLYEQLQTGSRWNSDFIYMLSLAAGIATLGLLQSSPAVVIGSMLLAPLMTPMIGMGLALNQGNAKLARSSFHAIGRGFIAALAISMVLARLTPGSDLTPEVLARTEPNVLDLLIAIFSGSAAAYALARPSLAGTVAGVAIATALVPPLCAAGISLRHLQIAEGVGALSLLLTNVLAIILAAAGTFRAMGLSALTADAPKRFWVRHVVAGLTLCVLAITIPLVTKFMQQVRQGKNASIAYALTNEVRDVLHAHVAEMPGVEIIFAGRSGVHRDHDPVDVGIILSSKTPLPRSESQRLEELMRKTLQNPDLSVRVECVVAGWADLPSDNSTADVSQQQ